MSMMPSDELSERLDRLQAEVSQLRDMTMMMVGILQVMAIKQGIAPAEFQAMSPAPIPTPFDIVGILKAND
jgi:hypothetical protein